MVGQTLGHYRILELLGKGGMGEVYRAQDEVLGRDVAIKVLPPSFREDPERMARFEREAKILASLNHANIGAVYGLEQDDTQQFLVLELVEGETLAEKLVLNPLPLGVAVPIAIQIAKGLEAAHEKGIVHRDLKPSNVMVNQDGEVKVLDFGLAKPTEKALDGDADESPTLTYAPTGQRVIMGTAAYMSPEQIRGTDVDKRSDIWTFGVVLWEMLTGKRPFEGDSASDVMASALVLEPDWKKLPERTPAGVQRVLHRCLVQSRRERLHDIADARIELQEAVKEPESAAASSAGAKSRWVWPLATLALLLLVAGVWFLRPKVIQEPPPTIRFEVQLPEGERLAHMYQPGVALSPDGRLLAYVSGNVEVADVQAETSQIYLHSLELGRARPLSATRGATLPFFSPDGRWLAFVTRNPEGSRFDRIVKKVLLASSEVTPVCEIEDIVGATWTTSDDLVFGSLRGGLYIAPARGGEPTALTTISSDQPELRHRLPHALPGGEVVLFTEMHWIDPVDSSVVALDLATGEQTPLLERATNAQYIESGHLVFARAGELWAAPFDPKEVRVVGPQAKVASDVSHSIGETRTYLNTGAAQFTVSSSGILAFARGSVIPERRSALVLVDRSGDETPVSIEKKSYIDLQVASDGRSVLLSQDNFPWEAWLYDLERGTLTRETFNEARKTVAIWGPEKGEITHTFRQAERIPAFIKGVGSGATEGEVLTPDFFWPRSWSPDGRFLAASKVPDPATGDIWIVDREGSAQPFLESKFFKDSPSFSPDGSWILYSSTETGRPEIYVRPFPAAIPAIQVSTAGGWAAEWSADGSEIVYQDSEDDFYSVTLDPSSDRLVPGKPVKLFKRESFGFGLIPDGRILMIAPPDTDDVMASLDAVMPTSIQVVQNWFEKLEQKAPHQ